MTGRVLILGASGRIGRNSAAAFSSAGWQVETYNRRDDMTDAARGVDVIVNGLNPPNYHDWKTLIPQITDQVITAARHSGASVILPGNVYHFGDRPGIWSETTPPRPVSRKGAIRLEMEQRYAQSGLRVINLRAGNFIDPDGQGDVMAEVYLRALGRGRFTLPGPDDIRQAFCYLPDWARAAVALSEMRGDLATYEAIGFPGHTLTARQIREGIERITGTPLKQAGFPWGILKLASPFWELAREVTEMRYLWETDHTLCGERLEQLLPGFAVTPIDEVFRTILPRHL